MRWRKKPKQKSISKVIFKMTPAARWGQKRWDRKWKDINEESQWQEWWDVMWQNVLKRGVWEWDRKWLRAWACERERERKKERMTMCIGKSERMCVYVYVCVWVKDIVGGHVPAMLGCKFGCACVCASVGECVSKQERESKSEWRERERERPKMLSHVQR